MGVLNRLFWGCGGGEMYLAFNLMTYILIIISSKFRPVHPLLQIVKKNINFYLTKPLQS